MKDPYGRIQVGDRVRHVKEPNLTGVVVAVDENLEGVTTCEVSWDGDTGTDVQWTNRLELEGRGTYEGLCCNQRST